MALTKTQISELYVSIFNRASEKSGSQNWLNSGYNTDATTMANAMLDTDAARTYFGTSLDDDAAFVEHIYANTLNKGGATVDAAGKAGWVEFLKTGASRGEMVAKMIEAIKEYQVGGAKYATADQTTKDAAQQFDNRVKVSDYTADTLETIAVSEIDSKLSFSSALTVTADPATIDSAKATIDATNPANVGGTFTLTTGTDLLIGTTKNDTFTGANGTYADADQIVDSSTTDNDTANVIITAAATPNFKNVENVNITTEATTAFNDVDASKLSGVKVLTVTGGDLVVGGSSIVGNKDIIVTNVDSSKVAKVVAGTGTKAFTLDQTAASATDSVAGVVVNADTAVDNVTITGAVTLDAANTGKKVEVKAINGAKAGENAKAVTVNAAKALDVEINDNAASKFTGAITVNAAAAKEVQVQSASGGVTINAEKGADSAGNGIVVAGIDDSGANITVGTFGSMNASTGVISNAGKISVDGSGSADSATIKAAGYINLTSNASDQVETLNLSGNGASVRYDITGAATTYNLTGDQDVTLAGAASSFHLKTVTDSTTDKNTTLLLTTLATADLSKVAVDTIKVASNVASQTLTLADNANVLLASDINTGIAVAGKNADYTVNLSTGDDTNASGAIIDITTGTLTASSNLKTVNIDATTGKLTMSTATTLDTTATLNVSGTKDVALATVTAKEVNAASSTGKITMTTGNAALTKITTGSGNDDVTVNQNVKYTVDLGEGTNKLTITAAVTTDGGSFTTGSGDDTIELQNTAANVIVTGAGNDTVNVASDTAIDSVIVMGDGTSDKLAFTSTSDLNLSTKTNFAVTGVEIIDVSAVNGSVIFSAAQFAQDNTFKLSGNATDLTLNTDRLKVINTSTTAGATIDASNVTFDSTQAATLVLEGAALLKDTITGSAKNDLIIATTGGDTIDGGAGTDTYDASALAGATEGTGTGTSSGVVINLGTSAITNTTILGAGVGYTADTITSVAANTVAYVFASADSTNSAVTSSIVNVENVIGTAGNDYIVGSATDNVITGGTGADILTGGAGNDTFVFATGDSTATATDKITDFAFGSDKLKTGITKTGTYIKVQTDASITSAANLAAAATAANVIATTDKTSALVTGDAYIFTYNSKVYLVEENGTNAATFDDGSDFIVEITGYSGTIATADIIA